MIEKAHATGFKVVHGANQLHITDRKSRLCFVCLKQLANGVSNVCLDSCAKQRLGRLAAVEGIQCGHNIFEQHLDTPLVRLPLKLRCNCRLYRTASLVT